MEQASLNLMTISAVPEDAGCLLFHVPVSDITKEEEEVLTSYLENGGRMILITGISAAEMPNLSEVMSGYGWRQFRDWWWKAMPTAVFHLIQISFCRN